MSGNNKKPTFNKDILLSEEEELLKEISEEKTFGVEVKEEASEEKISEEVNDIRNEILESGNEGTIDETIPPVIPNTAWTTVAEENPTVWPDIHSDIEPDDVKKSWQEQSATNTPTTHKINISEGADKMNTLDERRRVKVAPKTSSMGGEIKEKQLKEILNKSLEVELACEKARNSATRVNDIVHSPLIDMRIITDEINRTIAEVLEISANTFGKSLPQIFPADIIAKFKHKGVAIKNLSVDVGVNMSIAQFRNILNGSLKSLRPTLSDEELAVQCNNILSNYIGKSVVKSAGLANEAVSLLAIGFDKNAIPFNEGTHDVNVRLKALLGPLLEEGLLIAIPTNNSDERLYALSLQKVALLSQNLFSNEEIVSKKVKIEAVALNKLDTSLRVFMTCNK